MNPTFPLSIQLYFSPWTLPFLFLSNFTSLHEPYLSSFYQTLLPSMNLTFSLSIKLYFPPWTLPFLFLSDVSSLHEQPYLSMNPNFTSLHEPYFSYFHLTLLPTMNLTSLHEPYLYMNPNFSSLHEPYLSMNLNFTSLHEPYLSSFHDDLIYGFIQHIGSSIDCGETSKPLGEFSKTIQRVQVWRLT